VPQVDYVDEYPSVGNDSDPFSETDPHNQPLNKIRNKKNKARKNVSQKQLENVSTESMMGQIIHEETENQQNGEISISEADSIPKPQASSITSPDQQSNIPPKNPTKRPPKLTNLVSSNNMNCSLGIDASFATSQSISSSCDDVPIAMMTAAELLILKRNPRLLSDREIQELELRYNDVNSDDAEAKLVIKCILGIKG